MPLTLGSLVHGIINPKAQINPKTVPITLFHDITGSSMWSCHLFPELIKAEHELKNPALPAHGINVADFSDGAPEGLEAFIEKYYSLIRAKQAHGPYCFVGYSFGGVLAYLLAQRMEAENEAVASLILIDSLEPGLISKKEYFAREFSRLIYHFKEYPWVVQDFTKEFTENNLFDYLKESEALDQIAKVDLAASANSDQRELWSLIKLFLAMSVQIKNTSLKRTCLTVYSTEDTKKRAQENYGLTGRNLHSLGWTSVSKSPIVCNFFPGDHFSILKDGEEGLKELAMQLARDVHFNLEHYFERFPKTSGDLKMAAVFERFEGMLEEMRNCLAVVAGCRASMEELNDKIMVLESMQLKVEPELSVASDSLGGNKMNIWGGTASAVMGGGEAPPDTERAACGAGAPS